MKVMAAIVKPETEEEVSYGLHFRMNGIQIGQAHSLKSPRETLSLVTVLEDLGYGLKIKKRFRYGPIQAEIKKFRTESISKETLEFLAKSEEDTQIERSSSIVQ